MSEKKPKKSRFEQPKVRITTICGPMCAGKSAKIIEYAGKFETTRSNYVCLKPDIDNRIIKGESTKQKIVSRGAKLTVQADSLEVNFNGQKTKDLVNKHDIFIFDEVQFFDKKSVENFVKLCYESLKYKEIVFAGLDMDFAGKEFETVAYTKSISDEITLLRAMCSAENCLEKATHSAKIAGSKDKQVEVGGDDMYKPMCEKHWREFSGF